MNKKQGSTERNIPISIDGRYFVLLGLAFLCFSLSAVIQRVLLPQFDQRVVLDFSSWRWMNQIQLGLDHTETLSPTPIVPTRKYVPHSASKLFSGDQLSGKLTQLAHPVHHRHLRQIGQVVLKEAPAVLTRPQENKKEKDDKPKVDSLEREKLSWVHHLLAARLVIALNAPVLAPVQMARVDVIRSTQAAPFKKTVAVNTQVNSQKSLPRTPVANLAKKSTPPSIVHPVATQMNGRKLASNDIIVYAPTHEDIAARVQSAHEWNPVNTQVKELVLPAKAEAHLDTQKAIPAPIPAPQKIHPREIQKPTPHQPSEVSLAELKLQMDQLAFQTMQGHMNSLSESIGAPPAKNENMNTQTQNPSLAELSQSLPQLDEKLNTQGAVTTQLASSQSAVSQAEVPTQAQGSAQNQDSAQSQGGGVQSSILVSNPVVANAGIPSAAMSTAAMPSTALPPPSMPQVAMNSVKGNSAAPVVLHQLKPISGQGVQALTSEVQKGQPQVLQPQIPSSQASSGNPPASQSPQSPSTQAQAPDHPSETGPDLNGSQFIEALDLQNSPISGVINQILTTESAGTGNQVRGWELAVDPAKSHWSTLSWFDSAVMKDSPTPLLSNNTIVSLQRLPEIVRRWKNGTLQQNDNSIIQQGGAGIVFGKIAAGWEIKFSGRSEDPIFLDAQMQPLAEEEEIQSERYFVFLNADPGFRRVNLKYQQGQGNGTGAVVFPVLGGTSTYLDLSQISMRSLSGTVLNGASDKPQGLAGARVRVVGQEDVANSLTDEFGHFEINHILTVLSYPVYVDTDKLHPDSDKISGFVHRYRVLPQNMHEVSFYRFPNRVIKDFLDELQGGISQESGVVIAAVPQFVKNHPQMELNPSVRSLPSSTTLEPETYTISGSGQLEVRTPLEGDATRFLGVQIPEGLATAQVDDGAGNLLWGELLMVSPQVVNIVGPY